MEILKTQEEDEKTLVWCCFRADIRRISAELTAHNIGHVTFFGETKEEDREEAVRKFNCDPSCKVFIANPASAREGLNLWGYNPDDPNSHTNATKAIYFSQNWSYLNRAQSEDRCHRIGTRVSIQYIDLVIPNTIDEQIRSRVVEKKDVANSVQDLREIAETLFKTFDLGED
jgi:SNF2 family DNA or RNA helicase